MATSYKYAYEMDSLPDYATVCKLGSAEKQQPRRDEEPIPQKVNPSYRCLPATASDGVEEHEKVRGHRQEEVQNCVRERVQDHEEEQVSNRGRERVRDREGGECSRGLVRDSRGDDGELDGDHEGVQVCDRMPARRRPACLCGCVVLLLAGLAVCLAVACAGVFTALQAKSQLDGQELLVKQLMADLASVSSLQSQVAGSETPDPVLESLRSNMTGLQTSLASQREAIRIVQESQAALLDDISMLQDSEEAIHNLMSDFQRSNMTVLELVSTVNAVQGSLSLLYGNLQHSNMTVLELTTAVDTVQSLLNRLSRDLSMNFSLISAELSNQGASVQQLAAISDSLNLLSRNLSTNVSLISTELSNQGASIQQLTASSNSLNLLSRDLSTNISLVSAELSNQGASVQQLATRSNATETHLTSLVDRVERLHSVVAQDVSSNFSMISTDLSSHVLSFQQFVSSTYRNISMLEGFLNEVNTDLTALGQSLGVNFTRLEGMVIQLQTTHSSDIASLIETLNANISHLHTSIGGILQITAANFSRLELVQHDHQVTIEFLQRLIGQLYPVSSCSVLLLQRPFAPSGHYWISLSNGSSMVRVYCNMTLSCGNSPGGWMRVAELNWTDPASNCPEGLNERVDQNIRTCGISSGVGSCAHLMLSTNQVLYSRVCGRVIAYQDGGTDAFAHHERETVSSMASIESNYVDGVSLTHGSNPRMHIWTFASALNEEFDRICSCSDMTGRVTSRPPPPFVGDDYFCDTGSQPPYSEERQVFHPDNPLWDGSGCGPDNTCCSFNNPPWFYKQLPSPTSDSIEMRVCRDEERANEDIAMSLVEIYVQ